MATTPTAEQMAALLAQWTDWLGGRTDAMLSLEDRVRTAEPVGPLGQQCSHLLRSRGGGHYGSRP